MENADKLKKLVNLLDDGVEIGEKVFADGKISIADLATAPEVVQFMTDLFSLITEDGKEIIAELKDLDFTEAKELLDEAGN